MAIILNFSNFNNRVVTTGSGDNKIYSDDTYLVSIVGTISSTIPGGENINQAYSSGQSNVNWDSYSINGSPPTFPLLIPDGAGYEIIFNFYPSGVVSTLGKVVFDFGVGVGFYQYDFLEIDPSNSINSINPTLNFPNTVVGSQSSVDMYINNETCISQNYYYSCVNPEISFGDGQTYVPWGDSTLFDRVYWSPTSAYTLSDQVDILADTYPVGNASSVNLTGDSINPPTSGVYSKKTNISNSISF
jgi:hypothetical protein